MSLTPLPPATPRFPTWLHALIGGVIIGLAGFLPGFFGPMFLEPDSPQGPMLGIFVTGPLGFVIGVIGGAIAGLVRNRQ